MIESLTIFLNTHSSYSDCWPMFFGQLEKHWPDHPPALMAVDRFQDLPAWERWSYCTYNKSASFGQQYLQGLSHVTTDYVLTMQEDYILYADVTEEAIKQAQSLAQSCQGMRLIDSGEHYKYSMQASVWKTEDLLALYIGARKCDSPWKAELYLCHFVFQRNVLEGCQGAKRGKDHYDSTVFPYISTALRRGKWNLSEYPEELGRLLKEYNIDPSIRGTV